MAGQRRIRRYFVGRIRAANRRGPSPRVAIIGAGFGGLATAVALRRAGVDDLIIIDAANGVGGTWRQNTYPGAACDVMSHLYSLSFAPNRSWSRTFATQPEILAYLETVADEFDLRRHLMLHTVVKRARWDEATMRWGLEFEGTAQPLAVDAVVSAVGLFAAPNLPGITGLGDFAGPVVHTARWDHDVDFAGRRVAVIGTGASAVQVVPELAKAAAHVTVFQRTPAWMLPKDDRPYSPEELTRFRRNPFATRLARWQIWKQQHESTAVLAADPRLDERRTMAKAYLDHKVRDQQLRDALTPEYPFGCKRVLLGGKYYAALQRENVALVTVPIERVTRKAIVAGVEQTVDVDAIVLATGFETTRYLASIEVIGERGQRLHDRWGAEPRAYLGAAVSGFPNFFMIYGPNTNQGGNSIVYILEAGARLVARAITRLARRGGQIQVHPEAEARFNDQLSSDLEQTVWSRCSSYFRSPSGRIVTQWPYTGWEYTRRTWRLHSGDWLHRDGRSSRRISIDEEEKV